MESHLPPPEQAPLPIAPFAIEHLAPLFPGLEVKRLIAVGGMGGVYLARQISLDRPVALKILPPANEKELGTADRFATEARLMAQLSHPNIVSIYDFGRTGNLYYFMMEYVQGGTFHELIQAKRINATNATQLMIPICSGVSYAHKRNVLHHDLKPGNLMLNTDFEAKLLDFGLAGIFKPGHRDPTAAMWGTADYAAPERFIADAPIDHRADLYSLGVIYYEMLTGKLPDEANPQVAKSIGFNGKIDEVIKKCLAKDPDDRYPSVADFESDLKKLLKLPRIKSKPARSLVPVGKASASASPATATAMAAAGTQGSGLKRPVAAAAKRPAVSGKTGKKVSAPVVRSVSSAKPVGSSAKSVLASSPKPGVNIQPQLKRTTGAVGGISRRPPPPQDEATIAAQKQAQEEWEIRMKAEKKRQDFKVAFILFLTGGIALGLLIFFLASG